MKLYIENGDVLFDFSDIDINASLDKRVSRYREFLRDTICNWRFTNKHNVMLMVKDHYDWATEYGNLKRFESCLSDCIFRAKQAEYIEVSASVEELLQRTAMRCKELYDAEVAKEQERKKAAEWEYLCRSGCGSCKNCRRWEDDHMCAVTGDVLPEQPVPGIFRGEHLLFNYKPFPTENCPFNINKTQGDQAV